MRPPTDGAPISDPILGTNLSQIDNPQQLYLQVRVETRDLRWAPVAEQRLHDAYQQLLIRYGLDEPVRTICGSTLCEVAIKTIVPRGKTNGLMRDIHGRALDEKMKRDRLILSSHMFGDFYVGYWKRTP